MSSNTVEEANSPTTDTGEWGWEAMGSEDDNGDNVDATCVPLSPTRDDGESNSKSSSKKAGSKHNSFNNNSSSQLKGISSSPSFMELEKAIGATLALSLTSNDSGELTDKNSLSPLAMRSSTNLTQQKLQHQRMKQQQQHDKRSSPYNQQHARIFSPTNYQQQPQHIYPLQQQQQQHQHAMQILYNSGNGSNFVSDAREELGPLIDDSVESRALVLFHTPDTAPEAVRTACSKYGVLYYIRPEFHARGVTLLAYFDLRAAIDAKAQLAGELGAAAQASAHYSVMLHAATVNSEEARLVVGGLSASTSEAQVREVFGRYGPLKAVHRVQYVQNTETPVEAFKSNPEEPQQPSTESEGSSAPTPEAAGEEVEEKESVGGAVSSRGDGGCVSFEVEFFSIQDARVALSELSALVAQQRQQSEVQVERGEECGEQPVAESQPWSAGTTVEAASLAEAKQQQCRQLVSTIARWRHEMVPQHSQVAPMQPFSAQTAQSQQQHMLMHNLLQMNLAQATSGSLAPQLHPFPQLISPSAAGAQAHAATGGFMFGYGSQAGGSASVYDASTVAPAYMGSLSHSCSTDSLTALGTAAGQTPMSPAAIPHNSMFAATAAAAYNSHNMLLAAAAAGADPMALQQQYYQQQQQYLASFGSHEDLAAMHQQHLLLQQQSLQSYGYYNGGRQQLPNGPVASGGRSGRGQYQSQQAQNASHPYQQQRQQMFGGQQQGRAPPHHHNGGHSISHAQHQPGQYAGRGGGPAVRPHGGAMQGRGGGSSGVVLMHNGHTVTGHGVTGQQHSIGADFAVDLARIEAGEETRTTIMVRNIPNKYNQAMLLEEVNARHEGAYDFFYLPIDFKNRCNVGYAFVNFLDPRHIAAFVRDFDGQRWRSFNSEKVCAVSFARIQGKAAMVARFQNSSLLEKDDEYQPLLFYSSGPDRGKPEPFPSSGRLALQQQQQQQNRLGGGNMRYPTPPQPFPQSPQQQQQPGPYNGAVRESSDF